jgi:hypothetical protein
MFAADTVIAETECGHREVFKIKAYRDLRREKIAEDEQHRSQIEVFQPGPGGGPADLELAEETNKLDDIQYECMIALAECPEAHTIKDRGDWIVNIGSLQRGGAGPKAQEGLRYCKAVRLLGEMGYLTGDPRASTTIWEITEKGQKLCEVIKEMGPRPVPIV